MPQKNQHKPRPPDESIQEPLRQYYELGLSDVKIAELLKEHYDTNNYGLSVITIRRLRKQWGMLSTRQQNHTPETIYNKIYEIRKCFPLRGIEGICKSLRIEHDIRASRQTISQLLRIVEPDEVKQRRRRGFHRHRLWTAGINDVWPQDQHDKWGRFGLWLHAGIEAFSGEINWLKVWWTNKNPRLIAKYYLDTCRRIGGVPIITQSDRGTENYGVANAHTSIRHRLDPNLLGTLQHRFATGHNNILSEIKWSIFRRDFSPGFEDILEYGVNSGWYDVNDVLENLLFRWIAIPWLQTEVDRWVSLKNKSAPRASRHKLLPHGIPALIRANPSHFSAIDFKIPVPPELFDEMEARYAPPDHPVFELVPQIFHEHLSNLSSAIGQPEVSIETFWNIFRTLLERLHEGPKEQLTDIITHHNMTYGQEPDNMPLLPNMEAFRLGQPLDLGMNASYIGGSNGSALINSTGPSPEYADFTDDESEDEVDEDNTF
ncbi:hypothetical protein BU17DRAFT_86522 [Hysterangium stoloniferum]|nr:hypothetical protein BU17DRAFT_86522 [Hysterangium stoloniferum]